MDIFGAMQTDAADGPACMDPPNRPEKHPEKHIEKIPKKKLVNGHVVCYTLNCRREVMKF
ncbi:hypothetical protein WJ0W_005640 [Paenibacillus melissococcoides]|uniref:Uncharacterized protein n=1 Tax=Paenibacillus melissococcoides TaxID=2912268 RepID=A0ABM9GAE4_9BACL|nr:MULTISPECIES: hypothetical protein [Paenibacillus]MEB9895514.1 hypothetical protein [Bacillus cereus]CAH8248381.1 hypothetical protein WJ0W_005640 [Paenibacillus melissococcoides]CAH8717655.1 hypothetical protein HTL2_005012 [Paenibacillus melissococcoides]CAH8719466.1 hypothetical protein WDD9_005560 [Paenibacillus melissococcoides]GIO77184.1 hypothetical protein J6TS7_07940 [Paenibacillus dendritiformis]